MKLPDLDKDLEQAWRRVADSGARDYVPPTREELLDFLEMLQGSNDKIDYFLGKMDRIEEAHRLLDRIEDNITKLIEYDKYILSIKKLECGTELQETFNGTSP